MVENYEALIDALMLPDENDRHVLAAAIKCNTDIFFSHLFDLNQIAFRDAVKQQRSRLKNPPHAAEQLIETYYKQGLPLTVSKLKQVFDLI